MRSLGTTWTCRWGTLWLTTLFIATNVPWASIAAADRAGQPLCGVEERLDELRRQVVDRLVVVARDEQDVAGEEGAVVEEGERQLVVEHDLGVDLAGDDRAEEAVGPAPGSGDDLERRRVELEVEPAVLADVVAVDLDRERPPVAGLVL